MNKWTPEQRREFGNRLAEARTQAGCTQSQVAEWFQQGKAAVSAWEKGKNLPTIEQVAVLAAQFEVSIEALTHGESSRYALHSSTVAALSKLDKTAALRIENSARVAMGLGILPVGEPSAAAAPSRKQLVAGAA